MSELGGNTLSTMDDTADPQRAQPTPCIYLVLECERPSAEPARIRLGDVNELVVGRGAQRAIKRELQGTQLIRQLAVEDRWLSSKHARVFRSGDTWQLEDCGSKNGTRLNGVACSNAELSDGDIIGVGHTLLLFRIASLPVNAPAVVSGSDLAEPAPGMRTFNEQLAAELDKLARVAPSKISVLIYGESGTGKEVMARALHQMSERAGSFMAVNCGALAKTLVESELFGYRKGAFSGATEDRPGLIRAANKGTLFLDEIGDLPSSSQAAFLRALQEREVTPVGGTKPVAVDTRVVGATHRELAGLVEQGEFRDDLFARLTGFTLRLPPLRERVADMGLLIPVLLGRVAAERADGVRFTTAAAYRLLAYHWPRNVRELEKCLETAVVLAGDDAIQVDHLPEELRDPSPRPAGTAPRANSASPSQSSKRPLGEKDAARKQELVRLLAEHKGNVSAVARAMGTSRTQVHRWVKRYELDASSHRD